MSTPRLITPRDKAWQITIPQVVAAATALAPATNYFLMRSPVPLRIFGAHANLRTGISGSSATPGAFEFRLGTAANNNTASASAIGSPLSITAGNNATDDTDQDKEGFILPANVGLWIRCTSIGSTGTPAGLDVSLTVGFA